MLGLLVERLTGQPFGRVLEDRLLRPLGLTATSFQPEPSSATWPGIDVARGYLPGRPVPGGRSAPVDATVGVGGGAWAAGAVVSNAADLTRFYAALLSGRLLDHGLLQQMTTAVPHRGSDLPVADDGYGLGLMRFSLPCGTAWGHGGNIPPYTAIALTAPDGHRTATVLINGATGTEADQFAVATAMQQAAELAYCQRS